VLAHMLRDIAPKCRSFSSTPASTSRRRWRIVTRSSGASASSCSSSSRSCRASSSRPEHGLDLYAAIPTSAATSTRSSR
jgi:hypothetical protein